MPDISSKRIAIIGAGPSGAIALDSFLQAGFTNIVVYERQRVVGGTWNLDEHIGVTPVDDIPGIDRLGSDPNPPVSIPREISTSSRSSPLTINKQNFGSRYLESNLYPHVETNVSSEMMAFTGNKFPAIHPKRTRERFGCEDAYRTQDIIREYVYKYFEGKEKYLELNTTVEKVFQKDGPGSQWELVLRRPNPENAQKEDWWTDTVDFVYAATGRFYVPRVPEISGLKEAVKTVPKGTIIHSKVFRDPNEFKDKKLLLLGASWSNVDVAHLAKDAGTQIPVHLSLRSIRPVTVPGFSQPWIETHANITFIGVESDNTRLRVTFSDGSELRDVDKIVLGTGYRLSFPYLTEYLDKYGGIIDKDGRQSLNLYWTTWWNQDASLGISSILTDSITWRVIETQAKATAALWSRERTTWPTHEEAVEWETKRRSLNLSDFHLWYPRFDEFFNGLQKVGKIDNGPLPEYLTMYERSVGMKKSYWSRVSEQSLQSHPEWRERYARTSKYLEDRLVK